MNSSRRANKSNRGHASSRGGQGRGRGGRSDFGSVPTIQQVIVGAPVSIVLKVDQPIGRQVQGTVAELLTRGNHPRGIKVRLRDGRVGRVQKMATEEEATVGSEGLAGLGRNGEGDGMRHDEESFLLSAPGRGTFPEGRNEDFRTGALDQPERADLSLADYVVVKSKGKPKKASKPAPHTAEVDFGDTSIDSNSNPNASVVGVCPVCGEFEGDEMAIAHHVNSHFD